MQRPTRFGTRWAQGIVAGGPRSGGGAQLPAERPASLIGGPHDRRIDPIFASLPPPRRTQPDLPLYSLAKGRRLSCRPGPFRATGRIRARRRVGPGSKSSNPRCLSRAELRHRLSIKTGSVSGDRFRQALGESQSRDSRIGEAGGRFLFLVSCDCRHADFEPGVLDAGLGGVGRR